MVVSLMWLLLALLMFLLVQGRNSILPTPFPPFWPQSIFQWKGVEVYILKPPRAAGVLYVPLFSYTLPPLEAYFQNWGTRVYKIRPCIVVVAAIRF